VCQVSYIACRRAGGERCASRCYLPLAGVIAGDIHLRRDCVACTPQVRRWQQAWEGLSSPGTSQMRALLGRGLPFRPALVHRPFVWLKLPASSQHNLARSHAARGPPSRLSPLTLTFCQFLNPCVPQNAQTQTDTTRLGCLKEVHSLSGAQNFL